MKEKTKCVQEKCDCPVCKYEYDAEITYKEDDGFYPEWQETKRKVKKGDKEFIKVYPIDYNFRTGGRPEKRTAEAIKCPKCFVLFGPERLSESQKD